MFPARLQAKLNGAAFDTLINIWCEINQPEFAELQSLEKADQQPEA